MKKIPFIKRLERNILKVEKIQVMVIPKYGEKKLLISVSTNANFLIMILQDNAIKSPKMTFCHPGRVK